MVAVRAFIERAEAHAKVRNREQLRIFSPIPEGIQLPEELRLAVNAILKQIEDRALKPVIEAPSLEAATERAVEGFERFGDLWPAAIGLLIPWLQEHPNQLTVLTVAARDVWRSEEALRLGEAACEWFAAAQSARQALADIATTLSLPEGADGARAQAEISEYTVLADFAFMIGILMIRTPDARSAEGLALSIAKVAHAAATKAFASATMPRFADKAS
jgi:hypothetical protein